MQNPSDLFFYFFAIALIFSSLCVVLARNPLYNVLSLVVSIFCLSSIFVLLEAYFVSIILLLVYAGAVMIFFLFVVMCLNLSAPALTSVQQNRFRLLSVLTGVLTAFIIILCVKSYWTACSMGPSDIRGTIEILGKILFTSYLLPFELTSMLLLIALFGIVSLAQGAFSNKNGDANG